MTQSALHRDRELLSRLAKNDEKAFGELYSLYWKKLYDAIFRRIPDHSVVKDTLQDIFLDLWMRRTDLKILNPEAYLFGAVRKRVLKYFEKENRYTPVETLIAELEAASSSADMLVLREELKKTYLALVNTLTPSQQAIIRLRFEEDLTTAEIAEILEISRKTVQNQLRTALIQIRSSLVTILIMAHLKNFF